MNSLEGHHAKEIAYADARLEALTQLKQDEMALSIALSVEQGRLGMAQDVAENDARKRQLLARLREQRGLPPEPLETTTGPDDAAYRTAKERLDAKRAEIAAAEARLKDDHGVG